MNKEQEAKLIGLIYDAALQPPLWRQVLGSIKEEMELDDCTIFFYDAQCRSRNYANSAVDDESVIEQYLRDYIDAEVAVLHENFKHIPAGLLVRNDQLRVGSDNYEQLFDEGYSDMVNHLKVAGGIFLTKGKIIASAMGLKTYSNKPVPSSRSMAFLQQLAPHLVQAMQIHNQVTALQTHYTSIRALLEATTAGVFLLSDTQQVQFANNEAIRILESDAGLNITKNGHLQHNNLVDQIKLKQAIERTIESVANNDHSGLNFPLSHSGSSLPLNIRLLPIVHESARHFEESGANLAVFVQDPNRPLSIPAQYLRKAYGFTQAEVEIAQALLTQVSPQQLSQTRDMSLETTRWHLKNLFQKTNTHSHTELLRLLTVLSAEL